MALAITASWVGAHDPLRPSSRKDVFHFDTFGNETFGTDNLRVREAISYAIDPSATSTVALLEQTSWWASLDRFGNSGSGDSK